MAITAKQISSLLRQHAAALELFAAQWTQLPADAVQEAFIAFAKLETEPQNSVAWLYRVVRFKAMDAARAEKRRRKRERSFAEATSEWFVANPSNQIEVDETVAALKQLPIEQRETIVARLWGGLSFREIAELTESSDSTCHRRYQDGINALKKKLEAPCQTN